MYGVNISVFTHFLQMDIINVGLISIVNLVSCHFFCYMIKVYVLQVEYFWLISSLLFFYTYFVARLKLFLKNNFKTVILEQSFVDVSDAIIVTTSMCNCDLWRVELWWYGSVVYSVFMSDKSKIRYRDKVWAHNPL